MMIAAMLRTISFMIRVILIDAKITRELLFAPLDVSRLRILRIWLHSWEFLTSQIDKVSYQKGSKLAFAHGLHTNQYLFYL